ncbi:hypothetical protein [Sphingomonas sp. dw_22]|uniref:hypothetical protein n=1 Tax=Sphingomonas sp. dw_22 TaxID=2721175 RepID=UPI001BD46EFA|nr:hypothetical protein [Sphingomonas sp. dw_22]
MQHDAALVAVQGKGESGRGAPAFRLTRLTPVSEKFLPGQNRAGAVAREGRCVAEFVMKSWRILLLAPAFSEITGVDRGKQG